MKAARLLNFGCGATFHPDWTNLDATPVSAGVVPHDLHEDFPYPEDAFDAAYGSHVLEHLDPDTAMLVLRECFRILKPGGIVRIVVPDLEAIARLYLQFLEGAVKGDAESRVRYDWIMLELYDQAVRTKSAGSMGVYLRSRLDERQAQFISSRVGDDAFGGLTVCSERSSTAGRVLRRVQSGAMTIRKLLAQACTFVLLGPEGSAALREGIFRRSGEVHQWMYDRFSLIRALQEAGFTGLRVCAADESAIPGFAGYGLETANGRARKPDSLYVEGCKP
jgi:methyltransferase family protein